MFQVEIIFGILVPGQLHDGLQVAVLHRVVGRLWIETFQFQQLLLEGFRHGAAPFLLCRLLAKLIDLNLLGVSSQLLLYGPDLLLQEVLFLLLVEILPCFHLDIHLQFQNLRFPVEDHQQAIGLLLLVTDAQQLLLLPAVDRQVGTTVAD